LIRVASCRDLLSFLPSLILIFAVVRRPDFLPPLHGRKLKAWVRRWDQITRVEATEKIQKIARQYAKDKRLKTKVRFMLHFLAGNISSLLEIFSSLLEMTSLKIICLQNATDLRDSLKVSVSSCFTSSRLAPEPLPFQSGQALLDLVSEYGEPESNPEIGGEPEPCRSTASVHGQHVLDSGYESVQHVEHADRDKLERKVERLQAKNFRLESELFVKKDELAQAKADLAKMRVHNEIRLEIALNSVNPNVSGYRNGKIIYKPPPSKTPLIDAHFRIFGTHESVGPGPYANGSWYDWSNPGKPKPPLTHEFVAKYRKERAAKQKAQEEARRRAREEDPIWKAAMAKADAQIKVLADARRRAAEREAALAEQANGFTWPRRQRGCSGTSVTEKK